MLLAGSLQQSSTAGLTILTYQHADYTKHVCCAWNNAENSVNHSRVIANQVVSRDYNTNLRKRRVKYHEHVFIAVNLALSYGCKMMEPLGEALKVPDC